MRLFAFLCILLFSFGAFAADAASVDIGSILEGLANAFPKLTSVFAIAYALGLGVKILREAINAFVAGTPSEKDDAKWTEIQGGKIYTTVMVVLDLLLRVKPKKQ